MTREMSSDLDRLDVGPYSHDHVGIATISESSYSVSLLQSCHLANGLSKSLPLSSPVRFHSRVVFYSFPCEFREHT